MGGLLSFLVLLATLVLLLLGGIRLWTVVTRAILGRLLTVAEAAPTQTQFVTIDMLPLMLQLSVVGALLSRIELEADERVVLLLLLIFIAIEAIGSWWLSVRCLTLAKINDLPRRFTFQLLVAPIGLFFPILCVIVPAGLVALTRYVAPRYDMVVLTLVALLGVAIDAALLTAAYYLSRWVAAAASWPVVEQPLVEVEIVDELALATRQEVMS